VLWSVSIAIAVWLIETSDMIQYALLITAGAFVLAVAYLGWATWLTTRRDRMAARQSG
jgi:hypothetical protein